VPPQRIFEDVVYKQQWRLRRSTKTPAEAGQSFVLQRAPFSACTAASATKRFLAGVLVDDPGHHRLSAKAAWSRRGLSCALPGMRFRPSRRRCQSRPSGCLHVRICVHCVDSPRAAAWPGAAGMWRRSSKGCPTSAPTPAQSQSHCTRVDSSASPSRLVPMLQELALHEPKQVILY